MSEDTHARVPEAGDPITVEDGAVRVPDRGIQAKTVTHDLERQMDGARLLETSESGRAIINGL